MCKTWSWGIRGPPHRLLNQTPVYTTSLTQTSGPKANCLSKGKEKHTANLVICFHNPVCYRHGQLRSLSSLIGHECAQQIIAAVHLLSYWQLAPGDRPWWDISLKRDRNLSKQCHIAKNKLSTGTWLSITTILGTVSLSTSKPTLSITKDQSCALYRLQGKLYWSTQSQAKHSSTMNQQWWCFQHTA